MNNKRDQFWELLRENGYRLTRNRKAILEVIVTSDEPMGYEEIRDALKQQKVSPDRATIYRELDFLLRQNMIRRLQIEKRGVRYEAVSADHHHHAVCVKCDAMEHVILEDDVVLAERTLTQKNKFKILRHSLEFYGLCQKCQ